MILHSAVLVVEEICLPQWELMVLLGCLISGEVIFLMPSLFSLVLMLIKPHAGNTLLGGKCSHHCISPAP